MRHQLLTLIISLSMALVFSFGISPTFAKAAAHPVKNTSYHQQAKKVSHQHSQNANKGELKHKNERKEVKKVEHRKNIKHESNKKVMKKKEVARPNHAKNEGCSKCEKPKKAISQRNKCEQREVRRCGQCEKREAPKECEINRCDCDRDVAVRTVEERPCDCQQKCFEEQENQVVINCDDFDQHKEHESGQNCFGSIHIAISISVS